MCCRSCRSFLTKYTLYCNVPSLSISVVSALQLNQVIIPKHVMRGDDTNLACLYDLQGKELYSIKWYKDGKEFYRFEPSTRQSKKNFPQPGIKVDVSGRFPRGAAAR